MTNTAQLCETICVFFPLCSLSQEHVVKEDLLCALYCEFINRVNEVGVDVNKAIAHPHTQSLVQYVCGLGPRKGSHLLKVHFVLHLCCRHKVLTSVIIVSDLMIS